MKRQATIQILYLLLPVVGLATLGVASLQGFVLPSWKGAQPGLEVREAKVEQLPAKSERLRLKASIFVGHRGIEPRWWGRTGGYLQNASFESAEGVTHKFHSLTKSRAFFDSKRNCYLFQTIAVLPQRVSSKGGQLKATAVLGSWFGHWGETRTSRLGFKTRGTYRFSVAVSPKPAIN